jgi:uncharacterized protein (DUF302 family)
MTSEIFTTLSLPFDDAVSRIVEELRREGFVVVAEVDVGKILKEKLDVDCRRYHVLGVLNPSFAHQALLLAGHAGVLAPCNLIVQEYKEDRVRVSTVDPVALLPLIENPDLKVLVGLFRHHLNLVMGRL